MDEAVCAIRPGTDVARHAHLLAQVHDALLSGSRPPAHPRRLVARSWQRVRAQGVDPDLGDPPDPLGPAEVERRVATGEPHVLRFRVPEGTTEWEDMVHERIAFHEAKAREEDERRAAERR